LAIEAGQPSYADEKLKEELGEKYGELNDMVS
jgi:hypothetical protein